MEQVREWSVPGRVNLIGEHLDHNGGLVLPIAIDRRLRVKARGRDDSTVHVWSAGRKAVIPTTTQPGDDTSWAGYVAGVVWAFAEAGHAVTGADIVLESDLPVGAGLSSSAALTCGVALALDALGDHGLDRFALAGLARRAESDYVGVPVGLMDQLAVLGARAGYTQLLDFSTDPPRGEHVEAGWSDDGLALAVIDTRVNHELAAGEYAVRREECACAAEQLGLSHLAAAGVDAVLKLDDPDLVARTRHVITETARVRAATRALRDRSWSQLGTILTASHESLRDDFSVSCPELDVAVEAALEAGGLGARLTGGGFGGSAIALVEVEKVEALRSRVEGHFEALGWARPDVFVVRPADGATP